MKKVILTVAFFLMTITTNAQIGVLTLKGRVKYVPKNMWYTINEKSRKNQMYFTSDDGEIGGEVLRKTLFDIGIAVEDTIGRDGGGDLYWENDLNNGYICRVFYTIKENNYTITILTFE